MNMKLVLIAVAICFLALAVSVEGGCNANGKTMAEDEEYVDQDDEGKCQYKICKNGGPKNSRVDDTVCTFRGSNKCFAYSKLHFLPDKMCRCDRAGSGNIIVFCN